MTAIDRAIALATTTLKYGRAEEALPHREVFALRPLVEEAACAALECLTKPSACFDNCIDPLLMAEADREQLFRIVLNIARNACEATAGVGTITVSAGRKGGAVEIEIADNGPGIPEQVKAKLFQPFVSAARPGGSGLGLAIARDLARAHGGDLVLVRTGSDGTVFRIVLPITAKVRDSAVHTEVP